MWRLCAGVWPWGARGRQGTASAGVLPSGRRRSSPRDTFRPSRRHGKAGNGKSRVTTERSPSTATSSASSVRADWRGSRSARETSASRWQASQPSSGSPAGGMVNGFIELHAQRRGREEEHLRQGDLRCHWHDGGRRRTARTCLGSRGRRFKSVIPTDRKAADVGLRSAALLVSNIILVDVRVMRE